MVQGWHMTWLRIAYHRAILPLLVLLGFALSLDASAGVAAAPAPPNILMILADDLGFGDLSVQGAVDLRTPHIDALAAAGTRWVNFYANCTVCSPTRASLLTGRYPDLVGVPGVIRTNPDASWGYFRPNGPTLPEQLRKAGYRTGIVGKWHLGLEAPNLPNERGFDFFHGFLGDMMDDYYTHRRGGKNFMRLNHEVIDPKGHATDLFSDWAIDFISEPQGGGEPWFLYLAYNAPHYPVQPPKEWLAKVRRREPGLSQKRAKIVALIEHLDDGVGRVMDALRETGQAANTLVVFTSDNGGLLRDAANNGSWRGGKQDMYEGGLRVPFVAAWPGQIKAGSRSQSIALTMDLYATFCEVAGVPVKHAIDGRSLLAALRDPAVTTPKRDLFWPRREGGERYQGQDYHAVRSGDWKLLYNDPFAPLELYNLKDDPQETRDVSRSNPEVFGRLSALLRGQIQRAGAVPWQPVGRSD